MSARKLVALDTDMVHAVRSCRHALGMTQRDLAGFLDVHQKTIGRMERGLPVSRIVVLATLPTLALLAQERAQ